MKIVSGDCGNDDNTMYVMIWISILKTLPLKVVRKVKFISVKLMKFARLG